MSDNRYELVDIAQPITNNLSQGTAVDMDKRLSVPYQPAARPTKKDIDDAFDALANFLFEQYRKHKEEVADKIDN